MKLFFIKSLRKLILSFFSVFIVVGLIYSIKLVYPTVTHAQAACTRSGQCVNDQKCYCPAGIGNCGEGKVPFVFDGECGSAIIGGVKAPDAVANINVKTIISGDGDIGLLFFISRVINFANIVAGILVMINFVYVGFLYVTGAGNSSNMSKMNERLTWSFVGIIMIVSSYTLAAIFGVVFYGDPTFIISPTFMGALEYKSTI